MNVIKLCSYGCGEDSKFTLKNGKYCCCETYKSCPGIHKKIQSSCKNFWIESPDAKEKQSKLKKKQYEENPQILKNISNTVKKYYEENPQAIEEISKIQKQRYLDPEERRRNSERQLEYHKNNPEKGQNHSEFIKEYWSDPEARKKQSENTTNYFKDPLNKKTHSENQKKRFLNPDERKKLSEAQKKRYREHPEDSIKFGIKIKQFFKDNPHKHPNFIMARRGFMSSIERKVKEILDELNIKHENNYPLFGFFPDFAIIDKKIIIECDGDYWHSLPGVPEADIVRQEILESFGWRFIRFTEKQINNNIEFVKSIIIEEIIND